MHRKTVTVLEKKKKKSDHLQSKIISTIEIASICSIVCVCFGSIVLSPIILPIRTQRNSKIKPTGSLGPLKPFTKQVENCTMNNQFHHTDQRYVYKIYIWRGTY